MPHIIIEHSKDLNVNELAPVLHETLSEMETVNPETVKTRSVCCENVLLGSEKRKTGFCHITIKLLQGRDFALREKMARTLFEKTKEFFSEGTKLGVEVYQFDAYVKG